MITMKSLKIIALIILLASCNQKTEIDPVACKKVETQLMVIDNFISRKVVDVQRFYAVDSLAKWTGIESQSPDDDLGQGNPTRDDYEKWMHWYKENKYKIYWDKKSQKVLVR